MSSLISLLSLAIKYSQTLIQIKLMTKATFFRQIYVKTLNKSII